MGNKTPTNPTIKPFLIPVNISLTIFLFINSSLSGPFALKTLILVHYTLIFFRKENIRILFNRWNPLAPFNYFLWLRILSYSIPINTTPNPILRLFKNSSIIISFMVTYSFIQHSFLSFLLTNFL